jgi:hypothetical protein
MSVRGLPPALVAGLLVTCRSLALAAEGQAGGAPGAALAGQFKVLVWYDSERPFDSLRYRAYEVARGQYTKAVDDWLDLVRRSYPRYTALVLDVTAGDREPAAAIAAAVDDLKYTMAQSILRGYAGREGGPSRYAAGYAGVESPRRPGAGPGSTPFRNVVPRSFSGLGASGSMPSRPPYLFPNPFPYPRPHP